MNKQSALGTGGGGESHGELESAVSTKPEPYGIPFKPRSKLVEEVGRKIKSLRTERRGGKLTQGVISERAHISVSFLSMIERGERSPSIETLGEIAEGLGVSMAELFQSNDEAVDDNPAFRKLGEFLKSRRVTRADMDRLLAVARAMFVD
jgi:transcriptional regulator with XRE-family HTH domain